MPSNQGEYGKRIRKITRPYATCVKDVPRAMFDFNMEIFLKVNSCKNRQRGFIGKENRVRGRDCALNRFGKAKGPRSFLYASIDVSSFSALHDDINCSHTASSTAQTGAKGTEALPRMFYKA